jgi:hypothetical protein
MFSSVSVSGLVEDSWSERTPLTHNRDSFEVVAVGGKIYAIGGYTGPGLYESGLEDFMGINERYDPVSDTWVTLASMPTPRASFAIAEYQGKIYCMGGCPYVVPEMKPRCNVNEVYDIATDSWSTKAAMPFSASGIHAQVIDDQIFVINGNAMFMYDPQTDEWTRKQEVPLFLMPPVSAVVDDKIVLTGNFPGVHYDPKVMIYDPKTDEWSEIMTTSSTNVRDRALTAGATTGLYAPKKVHVLFGPYEYTHLVYDPENNTLTTAKTPPTDSRCAIVVINDTIYAIGATTTLQYIPIDYNDNPQNTPTTIIPPNTNTPNESPTTVFPFALIAFIAITAIIVLSIVVIIIVIKLLNKLR